MDRCITATGWWRMPLYGCPGAAGGFVTVQVSKCPGDFRLATCSERIEVCEIRACHINIQNNLGNLDTWAAALIRKGKTSSRL